MTTWKDLIEWIDNDPTKLEIAEKLYETLLLLRKELQKK
jgi:hypothetical protein